VRINLIRASELSPELRARWSEAQSSWSELAGPFFCPEFAEAVAAVGNNVHIAILEKDGKTGFFPFELASPGIAVAAGSILCDYQGVIAPSDLQWTAEQLLESCGLERYNYKGMPAFQKQFENYHREQCHGAAIDLCDGFESYSKRLRSSSLAIEKLAAARNRMDREHGPVRYEDCCRDPRVLQWLLSSKSAQYLRTGRPDKFQTPWITELLKLLHQSYQDETPHFGGKLSVLWAGDQVAAAHFGLRSEHVLHYWFPCYNLSLKKYSPGLILLMEIARSAAGCGISRIDLGWLTGISTYKQRFMTSRFPISTGSAVAVDANCKGEARYAHTVSIPA
jgi:CelD/BcsL family acetyltransferase involved in cellulose biosynthesis